MHQRSTHRSVRSGFTLVELMVVILIISVLSALLTMAVSRGIGAAKRTRNRVEISQLAAAVDAFKAYYKVDYIPSRIYLSESGNGYAGGVQAESLAYLQRLWPRLSFPVDWNGNHKFDTAGNANDLPGNPNGDFFLEGDQCLVFFLGGIPIRDTGVPACTGFSTNPVNPAAHVTPGGGSSKPPFYEFDSSRLVSSSSRKTKPFSSLMLSYLDTYGTSDGNGIRNGYNHQGSVDCLSLGLFPYAQSGTQYLNPSGFQIISAGADMTFGPGSSPQMSPPPFWTPATAGNSAASGRLAQTISPTSMKTCWALLRSINRLRE